MTEEELEKEAEEKVAHKTRVNTTAAARKVFLRRKIEEHEAKKAKKNEKMDDS